jgi:hypothetical protein
MILAPSVLSLLHKAINNRSRNARLIIADEEDEDYVWVDAEEVETYDPTTNRKRKGYITYE